jgi:signal transduction histidine kinase
VPRTPAAGGNPRWDGARALGLAIAFPTVTLASECHAPTILVVDYDIARLARTRAVLESEGYPVVVARDSAMAASLADASVAVLVLADEMQLGPTRRLVGGLRQLVPALQIVLLASARSGQLSRETLERLGVHTYVHDQDGDERLLRAVDAAFRCHSLVAQAQASDRLKMELLASVSHEFRSPLHIILGYLELAREGAFGEYGDALRDAIDKINWNAGHLLELVEDFLDLAKLESGTVKAERLDVGALVRALVADNELLVNGRPISLRAELAPALPAVLAESAKLRVVVQNLLTNALKFTERGEIVVAAERPLEGVIQVHVRDTGPGIPAEAQEQVFDLFRQLQPGDMRRKGIGLGLALARRFARAMGGDLTVRSQLGEGSTFTLTLPAAESGAELQSSRADA